VRTVRGGSRKRCWRDTISGGNGQGFAVPALYLCNIWWGLRATSRLGSGSGRENRQPGTKADIRIEIPDRPHCGEAAARSRAGIGFSQASPDREAFRLQLARPILKSPQKGASQCPMRRFSGRKPKCSSSALTARLIPSPGSTIGRWLSITGSSWSRTWINDRTNWPSSPLRPAAHSGIARQFTSRIGTPHPSRSSAGMPAARACATARRPGSDRAQACRTPWPSRRQNSSGYRRR
jgi:hypothetical protein